MISNNLRALEKTKTDFISLAKSSRYRARVYKTLDILIKILMSVGGAIITYFSDPVNQETNKILLRAMGIIITALTALSSLFTFEKRSLSHIQIYTKCQNYIPEIEDRIDNNNTNNTREYIKNLYKELSQLSVASFSDSLSIRNISKD
jgi:hypothetical protein